MLNSRRNEVACRRASCHTKVTGRRYRANGSSSSRLARGPEPTPSPSCWWQSRSWAVEQLLSLTLGFLPGPSRERPRAQTRSARRFANVTAGDVEREPACRLPAASAFREGVTTAPAWRGPRTAPSRRGPAPQSPSRPPGSPVAWPESQYPGASTGGSRRRDRLRPQFERLARCMEASRIACLLRIFFGPANMLPTSRTLLCESAAASPAVRRSKTLSPLSPENPPELGHSVDRTPHLAQHRVRKHCATCPLHLRSTLLAMAVSDRV